MLQDVQASLSDAQSKICEFVSGEDVLVGHNLDSDLRALKLNHSFCCDTSFIFPHRNNRVRDAPSLKALAAKYLNRQIQKVN
jgi:RNA exonuclease 1